MKILFDHCVPKPFRREFPIHQIKSAAEMGWEGSGNGGLLAGAASAAFEVFLTVDKNIKKQQNLSALPLAVIVLDSVKRTVAALMPFAPFVEQSLPQMRPGQMIEIDASGKVTVITPGRPHS